MQSEVPLVVRRYRERLNSFDDLRSGLNALKQEVAPKHLPGFLGLLARFPYYKRAFAIGGFPTSYQKLRPDSALALSDLSYELIWHTCVLKAFSGELSRFVRLELQFSDYWMEGNNGKAAGVLAEVEREFGKSAWLIEKKLLLRAAALMRSFSQTWSL